MKLIHYQTESFEKMTVNWNDRVSELRGELVAVYDAAVERQADDASDVEVRAAFTEVDGVRTADRFAGLSEVEVERAEALEVSIADAELWSARYADLEGAAVAAKEKAYVAVGNKGVQFSARAAKDPFDFDQARSASADEIRGQALTAIENIAMVSDDVRSGLTDMIHRFNDPVLSQNVIATSSDAYRSAFRKAVLGDGSAMLNDSERAAHAFAQEQRTALALGSGWQLPITIDPTTRFTTAKTVNPIRDLASKRSISTEIHHTGTMANASFSMAAEGAEVTDGTPGVGNVSINAEKAHGVMLWSFEAESDVQNLESDLRASAARGINNLEATQFLSGTGSSPQVEGLLNSTTIARVRTGVATVIDADDLITTLNAVPDEYTNGNTSWIAAQQTLNSFRLLESTGGAPVWTSMPGSAIEGASPTGLLGYNTRVHSGMTKPTGSSTFAIDGEYMIVGDFEAGYRIVDRIGMTVEPMRLHLGGTANLPTGQRGMYMTWRFGAGIINPGALRVLQAKAS
tara:strand:+ start:5208 stop:6755 length:1548 start_codon:yes stop_codon:yes gene_type:complete